MKEIKMGCSATWSQPLGPEFPLLLSHSSFFSVLIVPTLSLDPSACCFSRRWEGSFSSLPWSLALEWAMSPGDWLDLPAEMWEIQPRAIFAKATKLKARLGRLGSAVCTGGSAGLRDAFPLLWPEREIVSESSDEEHIFQTSPAAGSGASLEQGR